MRDSLLKRLALAFLVVLVLGCEDPMVSRRPDPSSRPPTPQQPTYVGTYNATTAMSELVLNVERDTFDLVVFTLPAQADDPSSARRAASTAVEPSPWVGASGTVSRTGNSLTFRDKDDLSCSVTVAGGTDFDAGPVLSGIAGCYGIDEAPSETTKIDPLASLVGSWLVIGPDVGDLTETWTVTPDGISKYTKHSPGRDTWSIDMEVAFSEITIEDMTVVSSYIIWMVDDEDEGIVAGVRQEADAEEIRGIQNWIDDTLDLVGTIYYVVIEDTMIWRWPNVADGTRGYLQMARL